MALPKSGNTLGEWNGTEEKNPLEIYWKKLKPIIFLQEASVY